jgi:hypothetical protein
MFALVSLVEARWAAAVLYAVASPLGAWATWTWIRLRRGETSPTGWPWDT